MNALILRVRRRAEGLAAAAWAVLALVALLAPHGPTRRDGLLTYGLAILAAGSALLQLALIRRRAADAGAQDPQVRFLEQVFNTAPDPVFVKDRDHRLMMVNDAFCAMAQARREDLLGKDDEQIVPTSQAVVYRAMGERVFATGLPNLNIEEFTDAAGAVHAVATRKAVFKDATGRQVLVGSLRDVTEQRRAERLLADREQMLRDIVDNVPAMVSLWSSDLTNRFVNRQPFIFNLPSEFFSGRTAAELLGEATVIAHQPYYDAVLRGEQQHFEMAQVAPSGETRHLQITFIPDRDEDGVKGFYAFGQDITDLKLTERGLRDAVEERSEALRQRDVLLREVYHRVKNNLQLIDGLMALQARQLTDPAAKEALKGLRRRVYALGLVHHQLMDSSDLKTFDIAPFLKELLANMLAGGAEQSIRMETRVTPLDVGLDFGIPLGLLVTELVTNALKHAFPDGAGTISVFLDREADGAVTLVVSDDGPGLAADSIDGDAAGLGSSLGARIVAGLVAQLNGTLNVHRDGGLRTEIRIASPVLT